MLLSVEPGGEDRLGFLPGFVLPVQVCEGPRRDSEFRPELALMEAVLEEALRTFRVGLDASDYRRRREGKRAERWIMARDRDWPFSFENICKHLGLDARWLRHQAVRLRARKAIDASRRDRRYAIAACG